MNKWYCLRKDFNEEKFMAMRNKHHLRNTVNNKYVVDSILICDDENYPYETMVFKLENGEIDSDEKYVERYLTYEEMTKRHFEICEEWEQRK